MTTTPIKRPSTTRKHTRTSIAKQDSVLDDTFEVQVDGVGYKLTYADMTGATEMRVRKETGMSVYELTSKFQTAPGIDLLGMFMWVCAISRGEDADLMAILESVSYASEVEVKADAEPDSPEA